MRYVIRLSLRDNPGPAPARTIIRESTTAAVDAAIQWLRETQFKAPAGAFIPDRWEVLTPDAPAAPILLATGDHLGTDMVQG